MKPQLDIWTVHLENLYLDGNEISHEMKLWLCDVVYHLKMMMNIKMKIGTQKDCKNYQVVCQGI